jgi:hypothetical protein
MTEYYRFTVPVLPTGSTSDYSDEIARPSRTWWPPLTRAPQVLSWGRCGEIWVDAPDEMAQAMLDDDWRCWWAWVIMPAVTQPQRLITAPVHPEGYNQHAPAFLSGASDAPLSIWRPRIGKPGAGIQALTGKALT